MRKRILAVMLMTVMLTIFVPAQVFAAPSTGSTANPADVTYFRALSSYNSIVLWWKKVPGAKAYYIKYVGNGKPVRAFKVKATSATRQMYVFPAAANKKYNFTIRAVDKNGKMSKNSKFTSGEPVRTMHYRLTLRQTYVRESADGKAKATFKGGTKITATGYTRGAYEVPHKGKYYRFARRRVSSPQIAQYSKTRRYVAAEAEYFVNKLGITSNTSKLIWVNTYTQRLYIFKGSKGKWKCVKSSWLVATGKPSTPTPSRKTRIVQKDIENHGLPYWSVCSANFSLHGRDSSWNVGYPASSACVRNTNGHAEWIFDNCGLGTGVYVF